jgi:hypothetical protein
MQTGVTNCPVTEMISSRRISIESTPGGKRSREEGGGEVVGSGEGTDILVVHVSEQLDLPQRALGVDLVVEGVCDLLDGHLLPGVGVERGAAETTGEART